MNKFLINVDMSLKDALLQIEKNKHRSLIVIDDDNRVVGTLSDGDIRKALIHDTLMVIPISKLMNKNFVYFTQSLADEEKNIFLDKKNIFIAPVVDSNFRLIDIVVKD